MKCNSNIPRLTLPCQRKYIRAMTRTIDVLRSLSLPDAVVTDRFGPLRDWAQKGELDPETGRPGWNADSGYRPIHYGVDHRAVDPVRAPGDGVICYDGKEMIAFVPSFDGEAVHDCAFYMMHILLTEMVTPGTWNRVSKGEPIANHNTQGAYPPHLHIEMAATIDLYSELRSAGSLKGILYTPEDFNVKAGRRGINVREATRRVEYQIESDGIIQIETDAIFRRNLPSYKHTPYSYLGHDTVAVLDVTEVVGDE